MNPFTTSPDKWLDLWKTFRSSLTNDIDELQQLESVAVWFAQMPTVRFALDCDDCSDWPSPWELIAEGAICENSLAYLMERTLSLSPTRWDSNRFKLYLINNREDQILRLCLIVDDQYVLNYSNLEIIQWNSICNDCQIQAKFKFENNKYMSY